MRRIAVVGLMLAASVAACSSGDKTASGTAAQQADLKKQADTYAIDGIEETWHKASSLKDLNLMMTIWADNATFTAGAQTYTGKQQIRNFFATKAAPFKPANHWVSDTPAYKIRTTVDGDKGTLYFECHYVDATTRQVKAVVAADQNVARINGRWVITSSVAATPILAP